MFLIFFFFRYYRQSLIFSSEPLAEINSLLMRHCNNYAGNVVVRNPIEPGTLCQVLVTVPQVNIMDIFFII